MTQDSEELRAEIESAWREFKIAFLDGHRGWPAKSIPAMQRLNALLPGSCTKTAATRPAERGAEGWVLVPPVPTDAMLKAWFGARRPKHIIGNERYFGCYTAMLEASPLPTSTQDTAIAEQGRLV